MMNASSGNMRASYLSGVLRAIQRSRDLVDTETGHHCVLQHVCDALTESGGVLKAQIKLVDETGTLVNVVESQAESVDSFGMVPNVHTSWIEHAGKTYGVLNVSLLDKMAGDDGEQGFLPELATHIASALYSAELNLKQQRTEKALQETQVRYREIGDNITDLFFALDKQLRCTYWNKAVQNLTGFSSREALGRPLSQLFPEIRGTETEQEYALAVRTQQPCNFIQSYYQNGKQTYFEVNVYPSHDDFSVFARDVTYRKHMEDALKKSWDYLENLNNSLGDAIFTMSMPDRRIEYVNRAGETMFGYSIDECIGEKTFRFFPDKKQYRDFSRRLRDAFVHQQEILRTEQVLRRKDQSVFTAEITTTFLRQDDRLSGVISIVRDVTERKEMQLALEQERASLARKVEERTAELQMMNARLARASQLKDQFLANMSHELRTPLNAILGYAKILQKTNHLSPLQVEGLDTIRSSGEHLLHLINDILDLSKIEAGRLDLHLTAFHFFDFLQHITNMIRVRAEYKQITYQCVLDDTLPEGIYADEKRLREVLINLLDNAVKFTEHGSVSLRVRDLTEPGELHQLDELPELHELQELEEGNKLHNSPTPQLRNSGTHQLGNLPARPLRTIRFEVQDSGVGIAPEQVEEIFLPFQQVGQYRQRQEGTGLGLAISQQLVKVMGGELSVESAVGQGSRFWFTLKIPEASGVCAKLRHPEIVGYTGRQRKILIVDDTRENRSLITNMLLPLGFDVLEAENGQDCLEVVRRDIPDAILLDLLMPVMDGFTCVKYIREIPEIQHLPVIAISASVFEETIKKSLEAGCQAFLYKPLELDALLECLGTLLALDWIYQTEADEKLIPGYQGPSVTNLPLETILKLRKWVEGGNITRTLSHLDHIGGGDEAYRPVITELRKMTKSFQLQEMLIYLDQLEAQYDGKTADNPNY
jgi:PAS domain S-box-containing protein